jgi:TolA-binding protein
VCCFLFSGCQTQSVENEYYKPLNIIQQEFYDIQTLYETGRFKDAIELGEIFIKRYPRDILNVSTQYYVAVSYQKTNNTAKAKELYEDILKNHPEDDWGKLAKVGLAELQDVK